MTSPIIHPIKRVRDIMMIPLPRLSANRVDGKIEVRIDETVVFESENARVSQTQIKNMIDRIQAELEERAKKTAVNLHHRKDKAKKESF